jgi:hypothetical protein
MHTLLRALAMGLLVLAAAPRIALACHQGIPHGNQASCDGTGSTGSVAVQFIGYTDDVMNALADTIDGGQGMLAMHALCQDDFGADARMCLDWEFWLSPNAEAPATEDAWLHGTSGVGPLDFIGRGTGQACVGWTDVTNQGITVTPTGLPNRFATCNGLRPVTCCAPAQ